MATLDNGHQTKQKFYAAMQAFLIKSWYANMILHKQIDCAWKYSLKIQVVDLAHKMSHKIEIWFISIDGK